ncbi:MAG: GNAT family N-acetyltransferase [Chthoniobacteraceae bacterium]
MIPPELIETPRLILRKPIAPDDAPRIYASYAHDAEVTRYLTWRPHRDTDESHRILRTRLAWWDEGREFSWLITSRTDGAVMGMISASDDDCPSRYTFGYVLARQFWGLGYMTEAARAVLDELFATPTVARVWAVADCENLASMRVLEKAGMQREGLLRKWSVHPALSPEPRDCWCYARVR